MTTDEKTKYPFSLGYDKDKTLEQLIKIEDVISCFIYKPDRIHLMCKNEIGGEDDYRIEFKMLILYEDLFFEKRDAGIEVFSKIDPGDFYENENSLMVIGGEESMFEGEPYRGVILKTQKLNYDN